MLSVAGSAWEVCVVYLKAEKLLLSLYVKWVIISFRCTNGERHSRESAIDSKHVTIQLYEEELILTLN
jgi:hypothetical protein